MLKDRVVDDAGGVGGCGKLQLGLDWVDDAGVISEVEKKCAGPLRFFILFKIQVTFSRGIPVTLTSVAGLALRTNSLRHLLQTTGVSIVDIDWFDFVL
ncbi:unnamed protein product [Allacma fusca]|uniref:Uncharacterized protein n=1 Tax=Allacma fusca TaxID=39272 RepID=A0A8J2LVV2_9HEXA|nr:unnamed protein product [Allacma fusca]